MDIADEGKEVVVFIAEDGLVAVFEKMPGATVPAIEVLRVPGEELSHDGRNAVFAAFKEDVDMVVHKRPCVDRAFPFFDVLAEPFEKTGLIFVVSEYFRFVDPSHHDVMQGAGDVQTGLASHCATQAKFAMFVE